MILTINYFNITATASDLYLTAQKHSKQKMLVMRCNFQALVLVKPGPWISLLQQHTSDDSNHFCIDRRRISLHYRINKVKQTIVFKKFIFHWWMQH